MVRRGVAACACALVRVAGGELHSKRISLDGLSVDAVWETRGDPSTIWVPVDALLEIPGDEATRLRAAALYCGEVRWGGADDCEATVAAMFAGAFAAGSRFETARLGSFPLAVRTEDVWGNPLASDSAATVAAIFRRERDFAPRCAAPTAAETPGARVAVIVTGELRILDEEHLAKLRRDLEGATVFVATHAKFEAAARDLTAPERVVVADPALLERELRDRGVAQVASSRKTWAPDGDFAAARAAAKGDTQVHPALWQWALLDLALDAFWEDLANFDVVAKTRADLDEAAPLPYADLRAAPGAIHCRSDFLFYGEAEAFLKAFDGARDSAEKNFRPRRGAGGAPRYEPLDWDLLLTSDLSGVKWWWLPLPVSIFGTGSTAEGSGLDAAPRTPTVPDPAPVPGYGRSPPRAFSRAELELVAGRARARDLLLSRRLHL